jgi:nucleoside-diphosphate-sugar epimerase
VALDLKPLDTSLQPFCQEIIQGDILDPDLLEQLDAQYSFSTIFHLASILSTRAEMDPPLAHRVNIDGTLRLLELAQRQVEKSGRPLKFIYPSSIAVYGLPDLVTKRLAGALDEEQWLIPTTMYGCNKLYAEHLGRYYSRYYRRLETRSDRPAIDFRGLRFPGLISADTVPTGGTSDYGPEMLHYAAQGKPYTCFVRPDSQLPFMAMPDAVKSLLMLQAAPQEVLSRQIYNVTSFCPSASQIEERVANAFPGTRVRYEPDPGRQEIVDSWPADIDDSAARHDWNWMPDYDEARAFNEYLVPAVSRRYRDRISG